MTDNVQNVLFISLFPPKEGGLSLQSKLLADNLEKIGLNIRRLNVHVSVEANTLGSKLKKGLIQPLLLFTRVLSSIMWAQHVHIAACSYWGFMPVVVAAPVCRIFQKPITVMYHGGALKQFLEKHHWWVYRVLESVAKVAVPSKYLQDIFSEFGIESVMIPPLEKWSTFKFAKRDKIHPVILSNRYLEPIYEVGTVLRAFCKIQQVYPKARLIVAGAGSQHQMLKEFAVSNDLRIEFRGRVSHDKMPELLREADIYINPSRVDNIPMSVLEAMRTGLLVITTPVGELTNIMRHGHEGYFYMIGDDDSLADTITFALLHQDMSKQCISNARKVVQKYTWARLKRKYLKLFETSRSEKMSQKPKKVKKESTLRAKGKGKMKNRSIKISQLNHKVSLQ